MEIKIIENIIGWIYFIGLTFGLASVIFPQYAWQITIFIIVIYLLWIFIPELIEKYREDRRYYKILKETIPKVENINLDLYQNTLLQLRKFYETKIRLQKVELKDKEGNVINICPKCGEYMRLVNWRGKKFLGCSNYPRCKFTRAYNEIFKIKI